MMQFYEIRLKEIGAVVGFVWTDSPEEALGLAIALLTRTTYTPQGVIVYPRGRKLPNSVGKPPPKLEGKVHRHVTGNVQPVH
jgi:hypothetical protein